jgi:dipeptidyl aminopeptidase/acylaminoacyl peptidase
VDGASRLSIHDAADGGLLNEVDMPLAGWIGFPLPEPVWSPDSRFVTFSFSAPTVPGDVLLIDLQTGSLHQLTDSSADLAEERLVTPVSHRASTSDGHAVPCFIYTPGHSSAGSVVLQLHGGPEVQAVQRFDPIVQLLAGLGHTVVVPNVRGSDGYGRSWYSADDGRRRLDVLKDLRALHGWLGEAGFDPHRMALWGGSYGGYLVLAGLAFQPELWAAGVSIVGISSLVTFLENTAGYRRAAREREYGSLAEDRDFLEQASPLSDADSIAAPLLLIHGANDPRVPLPEARQIADAVRDRGGVCELLVYSDEGHGLTKRANRLDAYPRALNFLDRTLRG